MRRTGIALLGAVAMAPGAAAALLIAEWKLAKRGPRLASRDFPASRSSAGAGTPLSLVWLGDSLATGAGADAIAATLPDRVAHALGRPVEHVMLAVSGSRVADVADRQVPALGAHDPDAVIVCVGTNDVLYRTPVRDIREAFPRVLAAVPAGVPTVVVGPADFRAVVRLLQPLRALTALVGWRTGAAIREAVEQAGATYVDLPATVGPAMRRDPDRYLAVDRFHPSDDGYGLVAEALLAALRPLLDGALPRGEGADRAHR